LVEAIAADLLIGGGQDDPNLKHLAAVARRRGLDVVECFHESQHEPSISWDIQTGQLWLDDRLVAPRSAFVRYDVFTSRPKPGGNDLDRALAWYAALGGWVETQHQVVRLNRALRPEAAQKAVVLALARSIGLPVPQTIVTNAQPVLDAFSSRLPSVAKPIAGGAYCVDLPGGLEGVEWVDGRAAAPAFVQERLSYPEYRVYLIGGRIVAFTIVAQSIDHRTDRRSVIRRIDPETIDPAIRAGLIALAASLGIDFCAFDLKTDRTGGLSFLEVNTGPMFSGFDAVGENGVADAIVDALSLPRI
jgi:hypothetical protein